MTSGVCWICGNAHANDEPCRSASDARLGTLLEDKYQIVRELGAGGMGRVYEGLHVRIGRRVAIKFLLPEFAAHSEIVRRFENEARAAGSLEHENIAAVHDFGRSVDGACFLVMDFLTGEDCEKLLAREGPLPVTRVVNILLQVCRGLAVAHPSGIIHRDLKPANLFLTKRADRTELVKILDFGIAKLRKVDDQPGTVTGQAMGTPYYMSPEQARGDKTVDQRTDVYALGVILYELLSGKRPHEGDTYLEIIYSILHKQPEALELRRQNLPHGLVEVVRKAMSVELAQRYATVAELGEALSPFAGAPVAPFHSRPSVRPAAEHGEDTLASRKDPKETASTMAPLTPKTPASILLGRGKSKHKWVLSLGIAVVLGIVAVIALRSTRGGSPLPEQASSSSVAGAASPAPSFASPAKPLPDAIVSGHLERPDSGVVPAASNTTQGMTAAKPAARVGVPARAAKEPDKPATRSNMPVPEPVPATPRPTQAPAPHTIDISRDPNF
jgi:serine/threonine-protein kinase